jgi:hypothetical protein
MKAKKLFVCGQLLFVGAALMERRHPAGVRAKPDKPFLVEP